MPRPGIFRYIQSPVTYRRKGDKKKERKEGEPCLFMILTVTNITKRAEHWWKDTDRGNPELIGGKSMSQRHFVHHTSNMDWPGIELGLSRKRTKENHK